MKRIFIKSEQGGTLVETAIAATMMLGVVFSLFEMFMAFYTYHYVSYAARDAARYAIVRGSDCSTDSKTMPNCDVDQAELQAYVQSIELPGINPSAITVTPTWFTAVTTNTGNASAPVTTSWSSCPAQSAGQPNGCDTSGNAVQVKVTYAFPLNLPFFSNAALNLTSTSQMVISQ